MRLSSVLLGAGLASSALASPSPAIGGSVNLRNLQQITRSLETRGWVDEIWDEIQNAVTCGGCEAVLALLKTLADLGDDLFVSVLTDVCKLAEDGDVCEGAIGLEGSIIAEDLRNMDIPSKTAELFCITFLGLCEYPDIADWDVPFPSEKPSGGRPAPSGKDPIKVVHYSDIHIDELYETGANTDCGKPICCRPYTDDDEPGNNDSPAGPNGDHACDSPVSLEKSMYAAINDIVGDAAFTIFTGDIVDHAVWNTSQDYNAAEITNAYGLMNDNFDIVYGVAGNHEASPTNSFQPKSVGTDTQWVYDLLSEEWSRWIGDDATAEADQEGSYSVKYPNGNLRVISLNTNFYYVQNYWLYQKDMIQDPDSQIAWLVSELDAAESAGENVWIIGHMPLGTHDAFHDQSNYLDQVINHYSSTIAAMFFGHTHDDHFELTYSNYSARSYDTALVMSFIAPSLTPTSGMPSFRVYDVDPETFSILDATTYIADMTNEAFQTTGPVWTKYYSAKETYGPLVSPSIADNASAELSAAFWHNVTEVFESDVDQFNDYYARKSRGWSDGGTCDDDCRPGEICQLQSARAQDNCYEPTVGINFKKRSLDAESHVYDECGISISRSTVASLAADKSHLKYMKTRVDEETRKQRV